MFRGNSLVRFITAPEAAEPPPVVEGNGETVPSSSCPARYLKAFTLDGSNGQIHYDTKYYRNPPEIVLEGSGAGSEVASSACDDCDVC